MKPCLGCGKELAPNRFYAESAKCMECAKAYQRAYYAKNRLTVLTKSAIKRTRLKGLKNEDR